MKTAINLCDIGYRLVMDERITNTISTCDRIYIGSYFCDRYFLLTTQHVLDKVKKAMGKDKKEITVVMPTPSQANLQAVKQQAILLFRKYRGLIGAVVVNDFGMLNWVHTQTKLPVVLGRLFSKSLRDPRYPETLGNYTVPVEHEDLIQAYHCVGIEVEGCFQKVLKSQPSLPYEIHMHLTPFYMSCMRQCYFASIYQNLQFKFRPDSPCHLECSEFRLKNIIPNNDVIHRIGKAVYFEGTMPNINNADVTIKIPIEMW